MITTILLFLAVLFVLVLVHEWGHFIVAKKTGMRVDEFAIGFPPRLFGLRWGETEYTLNALPLGGFVRILGESVEGEGVESRSEADRGRAMFERPKWAQALVLIAGVAMNVLLAWALYAAVFMIGVPTAVDEAAAGPGAALYVVEVLPDSPLGGQVAPGTNIIGVTAGAVSLDTLTPSAFSEFVGANAAGPIDLTLKNSDGTESVVTVTPEVGLIASDPERKAVGVALALVSLEKQAFFPALWSATVATGEGLVAITTGLFGLIAGLFQGEADLSQVAGPVGIAGMVGDAASFGVVALLSFVAIISLNLAVINLLPFPALDGGRLVLLAVEAVRRRPVNPVWSYRLNALGFLLLMTFMLIVTYGDIMRLL